jgi:FixJ family two-component response regulator
MEPSPHIRSDRSDPDQGLVILVEDDAGVREALQFLLETEGFRTLSYRTGMELLARPDLWGTGCFVLDYHLPGLNGLEILSRLREQGVLNPTVFVTAGPSPVMRQKAFDLGAFAILEKPLIDDDLTRTVREALLLWPRMDAKDPSPV